MAAPGALERATGHEAAVHVRDGAHGVRVAREAHKAVAALSVHRDLHDLAVHREALLQLLLSHLRQEGNPMRGLKGHTSGTWSGLQGFWVSWVSKGFKGLSCLNPNPNECLSHLRHASKTKGLAVF